MTCDLNVIFNGVYKIRLAMKKWDSNISDCNVSDYLHQNNIYEKEMQGDHFLQQKDRFNIIHHPEIKNRCQALMSHSQHWNNILQSNQSGSDQSNISFSSVLCQSDIEQSINNIQYEEHDSAQLQEILNMFDKTDQQQQQQKQKLEKMVCAISFYWFDKHYNLTTSVQGTGFFIDNQFILTAKHNFYRKKDKVKCISCQVQVRVSQNKIDLYQSTLSQDWFEHQTCDLGMVKLRQPIKNMKTGIEFCNPSHYQMIENQKEMKIAGYSLEYRENRKYSKALDELHILKAQFQRVQLENLYYTSDTLGGFSGSPIIFETSNNKFYIIGLHLGKKMTSRDCKGLFFSPQILHQIYGWKQISRNWKNSLLKELQVLKKLFVTYLEQLRSFGQQVNSTSNLAKNTLQSLQSQFQQQFSQIISVVSCQKSTVDEQQPKHKNLSFLQEVISIKHYQQPNKKSNYSSNGEKKCLSKQQRMNRKFKYGDRCQNCELCKQQSQSFESEDILYDSYLEINLSQYSQISINKLYQELFLSMLDIQKEKLFQSD